MDGAGAYWLLPPATTGTQPRTGRQAARVRLSEGRRRGRAHGIYADPSNWRWGWGAHHQWRCIGGQNARIWSSRLPRRVRPRRRPTSLAWCFVSAPAAHQEQPALVRSVTALARHRRRRVVHPLLRRGILRRGHDATLLSRRTRAWSLLDRLTNARHGFLLQEHGSMN